MKRILLAALWCAALTAHAQQEAGELGGYVKYLFTASDGPLQDARTDHLLHARLNGRWYPTEAVTGVMELRARAFYGGTVRATPGFAEGLGTDGGFGRMGVVLWDAAASAGYAEVDRLFLNVTTGPWQFTVGRQRIAWGTNLVWNVVDVFNPQSVLDFDYEELPAVDGVRIQRYAGEMSKVEFVFTPAARNVAQRVGVQWSTSRWEYDIRVLAGLRENLWYGGVAWAGDIAGGGFRGEVLASGVPREYRSHGRSAMVLAAVSGDYTFPNSFYIHTEVMVNSEGVQEGVALAAPRSAALGQLSPARWSVFQECSYNVSPLVRAGVFAILNPTDRSWVLFPSLTWSVITDLDLSVFALFFAGEAGTEFGQRGAAAVARLKWSF